MKCRLCGAPLPEGYEGVNCEQCVRKCMRRIVARMQRETIKALLASVDRPRSSGKGKDKE